MEKNFLVTMQSYEIKDTKAWRVNITNISNAVLNLNTWGFVFDQKCVIDGFLLKRANGLGEKVPTEIYPDETKSFYINKDSLNLSLKDGLEKNLISKNSNVSLYLKEKSKEQKLVKLTITVKDLLI